MSEQYSTVDIILTKKRILSPIYFEKKIHSKKKIMNDEIFQFLNFHILREIAKNEILPFIPLCAHDCFVKKHFPKIYMKPCSCKNVLDCCLCDKECHACASIICVECHIACPSCQKSFCNECLPKVCSLCLANLCENSKCGSYAFSCYTCGNIICLDCHCCL